MSTTETKKRAPHGKRGGFQKVKKEFQEELLQVRRVTRVTAGGRQLRFRAVVVIGDRKGRIGFGIGKAGEVVKAIEKAVRDAKRNIMHVDISTGTVAHDITVKEKSAIIMLHPASEGTGIIAGGASRRILELAGFKNVLAKRYGSTRIVNNARATIKALSKLKPTK